MEVERAKDLERHFEFEVTETRVVILEIVNATNQIEHCN